MGAPADLTLEEAAALNGGGMNAFYRHVAAAVFAIYYPLDYLEPGTAFTDIIENPLLTGDFETAKDLLNAQNNLGSSICD